MTAKNYKSVGLAFCLVLVASAVYLFVSKPKDQNLNKYKWGSAISDQYKWPMVVLDARFLQPEGNAIGITEFSAEQYAPLTGKWGIGNGDSTTTEEPLPVKLSLQWLSLREKIWYKGEFNLPTKTMDSLFQFINGKQLIVGLAPQGKIIVWAKGNKQSKQIASFTAKQMVPNWELIPKEGEEDETAYIDRMYAKIGPKERDQINAESPLKNEKPVNGIYNGIYEFISQQDLGKEQALFMRKLTDTMLLINPNGLPYQLQQGDLISVRWSMIKGPKLEDSTVTINRAQAMSIARYKKGKLSLQLKKGMPQLSCHYYTDRLTANGKILMLNLVKHYLANATDRHIRKVVDQTKKPLHFTVDEKSFKGKMGYEIMIIPNKPNPEFSKYIYFHPSVAFRLLESQEIKEIDGINP